MANTFDSALVADSIAAQTKTILSKRLTALNLFASDFSSDVKKPKDTVHVPIASATASTEVNPSVFNSIGGTTVGKASVVLDHIYQPFGLAYSDLQSAHRLDRLIQINLDAMADKIWALVTAPITVANFGAATVTTASGSINASSGDLPDLWAAVSKSARKGLVVNPVIYSNLIPTNTTNISLSEGAYGFENGVHYASSFGGQANLAGFACSPEALVMASAVPALADNDYMVSDSVTLDQIGLTIAYNVYSDKSTRSIIASLEVMFGAAKGITGGTMALIVPAA
jgi:hypothetical protein